MAETIVVSSETERQRLLRRAESRGLPFTATLVKGERRSLPQNRLQWLWVQELARQGDMSSEEYRAWCKLHLGVPILRRDSEVFRESYDDLIKPIPYEQKLRLMVCPQFEFPVTRLMAADQMREYLDSIHRKFTELGFALTDPNWAGMEVARCG